MPAMTPPREAIAIDQPLYQMIAPTASASQAALTYADSKAIADESTSWYWPSVRATLASTIG